MSRYLLGKNFRKMSKEYEITAPSYQKPLSVVLKTLAQKLDALRCVLGLLFLMREYSCLKMSCLYIKLCKFYKEIINLNRN